MGEMGIHVKTGGTDHNSTELQVNERVTQLDFPISGEGFDDSFVCEENRNLLGSTALVSTEPVASIFDDFTLINGANSKADTQTAQTYMSYLPLALQRERNQQG